MKVETVDDHVLHSQQSLTGNTVCPQELTDLSLMLTSPFFGPDCYMTPGMKLKCLHRENTVARW